MKKRRFFPPGGIEYEEQSMWQMYKEAHGTLRQVLAPALEVKDFLKCAKRMQKRFRKQALSEEKQMVVLSKIEPVPR